MVKGDVADSLVLGAGNGFWTSAGTVSNSGITYTVYQNDASNSQVLVQNGVTVTNNDATELAGDATVALGAGLGQLMVPVQVEGKWYYYWDRSGDGTSADSGSLNGGLDYTTHGVLDGIFTQSIYGTTGGGGNSNDTYRYATLNGLRVALPTANGGVTPPQGINALQNGTTYTDAGATSNGTTSIYNDLLAIWDAYNGTGTNPNVTGTPSGWNSDFYWSATPATSGSGHIAVSPRDGYVPNLADTSFGWVALQVLAPTTLTAASYYAAGNTFTVTGTAFDSAGNVGDDIKAQLDWTKFGYDLNGDGVSDVPFAVTDIASATVLSATQLNIVLTGTKATALEALPTFDTTSAAVGGADKVVTQTGFTDTVYNTSTQVRDAWQSKDASSLGVTQSFAGQSVIDLGASGKLIAPVQVEGNWYYYWDRSGNGTSANTGTLNGGTDITSFDVLDGIFNKSSTGVTNTTVQNADGLYGMTETYRFSTINGIKLAVPTLGWNAATAAAWSGNRLAGTAYSDPGPTSNGTTTSTYDDFLAIWDSQNGTGTTTGTSGLPAGWASGVDYITASPASIGHYRFNFSGEVARSYDDYSRNVVLQVVFDAVAPVVFDLNRDGVLSYSQAVIDVNRDGQLDQSAWVGPQDGLLVWDKFHDGQVHDASQFMFATTPGETDLEGLAAQFDTNRDGVFDAQDALFGEFAVWQDSNQNGVSDAGEVRSLAELGLASFNLTSDGLARSPEAGVHEAGRTSALTVDGTQVLVADVGFEFSTLRVMDLAADPAANTLNLSLIDVLALPQQTLVVQGAANDSVLLAGEGWTNTGTLAAQNGHSYAVWHNNTAQALIDQQVMITGGVMYA